MIKNAPMGDMEIINSVAVNVRLSVYVRVAHRH